MQSVHLIRTAQSNTLALSQMADGKANILIGATFVVFSLVITQTFSEDVKWSVICLAVTSFLAAICAVLAITPPMRAKAVAPDQFNPLFFGHFATVSEEEWIAGMLERLQSDEALYRVMLRDLYQNGQVLHRRKYRYLALAYRLFLAGLGLTLAIYLIENAF
ncbi:Pycsar system effector family protein [Erythrobacter donghaensis]|uniref:Pycsar system effector family protein n=1 Tax=Erythrobacter donghaensis TaxID=267135 RepID=UPI001FE483BA|nr:Pycsar system effector family protein [Erythrobacter donghaensis]